MAFTYNSGLFLLADETTGVRWNDPAAVFHMALVTAAYVFDPTHTVYGDLSAEITNISYVAGGNAITTRTCIKDNINDRIIFDGDDVTYVALAAGDLPAAGVIYLNSVGQPKTLVSYNAITVPIMPSGGAFTIMANATTGYFIISNL
ncbi:MAG: hypothetical protein WC505_06820 [Patescibacteria group bacterium]